MYWFQRSIGAYFIKSDKGYKISFYKSGNEWDFAAWPPSEEGLLEVVAAENPRRTEKLPIMWAIGYCKDIARAKWLCDDHYAKTQGLEFKEFNPDDYLQEVEAVAVKETKKEVSEMPIEEEFQDRQPAQRARGMCHTVEDLVKYGGCSQGQAEKIIRARGEKDELIRRAQRACETMLNFQIDGFNYQKMELKRMKPKELTELIERATEKFKALKKENESNVKKQA